VKFLRRFGNGGKMAEKRPKETLPMSLVISAIGTELPFDANIILHTSATFLTETRIK